MRWSRRVAAGVATMLAMGMLAVPLAAGDSDVLFEVEDERVQTASGLAADRDRNMYWTVNAGSDSDRAFALNPDGSVEGTVRFGQNFVDPQAIVYIGSRLYVADIGDAEQERDSIAVHRFTDPNPVGAQPEVIRTFELQYSDGQARDARSLLVADSGQMLVITHEAEGGIWTTDGPPNSNQVNELTRVGDAPAWVTDAVFLPDDRIATRSYVSVDVLATDTYEPVARAAAPFQEQGEGMALSLDRQTLVLNSAGTGQDVLQVNFPGTMTEVPEPGPTPPASPAPTPTETPTPDPAEQTDEVTDNTAGGERTGTMVALLLAGALAVAAGLVVYFVGRQPGTVAATTTSGTDEVADNAELDELFGASGTPLAEILEVAEPQPVEPQPTLQGPVPSRVLADPTPGLWPSGVGAGAPPGASGAMPVSGAPLGESSPPPEESAAPSESSRGTVSPAPQPATGPVASVLPPTVGPAPVVPPAAPMPIAQPPASTEQSPPVPVQESPAPAERSDRPAQSAAPAESATPAGQSGAGQSDAEPSSSGQPARKRQPVTITENDEPPVRGRRALPPLPESAAPATPRYTFDEGGTWVTSSRSAEEQTADLDWLYPGRNS